MAPAIVHRSRRNIPHRTGLRRYLCPRKRRADFPTASLGPTAAERLSSCSFAFATIFRSAAARFRGLSCHPHCHCDFVGVATGSITLADRGLTFYLVWSCDIRLAGCALRMCRIWGERFCKGTATPRVPGDVSILFTHAHGAESPAQASTVSRALCLGAPSLHALRSAMFLYPSETVLWQLCRFSASRLMCWTAWSSVSDRL